MSDKLKVVGAKALDQCTSLRLTISVPHEGSPKTMPDPSWGDGGMDLAEFRKTYGSGDCINHPDDQSVESEVEPVFISLISRQG